MVRNNLENTSTESPDNFEGSEDESYGARLIINMEALVENWQAMRALSAPARCAAVIKADGYGLGANPVSAALYQAGCRDFSSQQHVRAPKPACRHPTLVSS